MRTETDCRYVPEVGRLLRTHLRDCISAGCGGCEPCPERHCFLCHREHVTVEGRGDDQVCARCLGGIRSDMTDIVARSEKLLTEAVHRGINSEAANLAGPSSATPDVLEAHRWRQLSAFWGRIPELPEDDTHPQWVLGSWEMLAREHLSASSPARIRLDSARAFLDQHLTRLAHDPEFPIEELARDVRECRAHLENVLRDSQRKDEGAPCPMCGQAKLQLWHADCECTEDEEPAAVCSGVCAQYDTWWCPRCAAEYAPADYRERVGQLYPHVADRLTAKQVAEVYRVPERTVRHWGKTGKVKRMGTDSQGRLLYAVADVLAMRDTPT